MSLAPGSSPERRHRILHIVCLAILSSLGLYVAVAWIVLRDNPAGLAGAEPLPAALPLALAGLAGAMLVSGEVVGRALTSRARRAATPEERLQGHVQAVIVGFALREAVGVMGLVLTLLSGAVVWVVSLAALAAAAMLLAWPRREELVALADPLAPPPIG